MSQPNEELNERMKSALYEAIKILFPIDVDPFKYIIPHVWRDKTYVGENDGRIAAWRGWSANLKELNPKLRTLYIDAVDNVLSLADRENLFGEDFCKAISNKKQFVMIFLVGCPLQAKAKIQREGFVVRVVNNKILHPCSVTDVDEFLSVPPIVWSAKMVKLLNLYAQLCAK